MANLNDTDGDNIPDVDDNSVIAAPNSRNEVDLMRLDILMHGSANPSCGQTVYLIVTGNVSFWKTPNKVDPLLDLTFDINELPVTIFIEAKTWSEFIRDIEIKVQYNEKIQDVVKATAVWVRSERKFLTRGNNNDGSYVPDGLPDNPNPYNDFNFGYANSLLRPIINNHISTDNSRYGFGSFQDPEHLECEIGGRILFEFSPVPFDIKLNDLGLSFDIGRKQNSLVTRYDYGSSNLITVDSEPWPNQVEASNDDDGNGNGDEDRKIEEESMYFYSYDAPGSAGGPLCPGGASSAYRFHTSSFIEYVRVGFKNSGDPFSSNLDAVIGSRCSNEIPWNFSYALKAISTSNTDPYLPENQAMVLVTSEISASAVRRNPDTGGGGNGIIDVQLSPLAPTAECRIQLLGNTWHLWVNGDPIDEDSSTNGPWTLVSPNGCFITITNGSIPFSEGISFFFNIFHASSTIINELNCD